MKWNENAVAHEVVDVCFKIHKTLGPGLLESVYEMILAHELAQRGLSVRRQVGIPVSWENQRFSEGFRPDLIVENKVIVEVKSIDALAPVHAKVLLTYLKLTGIRLGLLVNFGEELIRNGIRRVVNGLEERAPEKGRPLQRTGD